MCCLATSQHDILVLTGERKDVKLLRPRSDKVILRHFPLIVLARLSRARGHRPQLSVGRVPGYLGDILWSCCSLPSGHKLFAFFPCVKCSHLLLKWSEVAQSCPTLCNPMDCILPGSSIHGIFQARVLEWVTISFSRGSSRPQDRTEVSRIAGRRFTVWDTREAKCLIPFQPQAQARCHLDQVEGWMRLLRCGSSKALSQVWFSLEDLWTAEMSYLSPTNPV